MAVERLGIGLGSSELGTRAALSFSGGGSGVFSAGLALQEAEGSRGGAHPVALALLKIGCAHLTGFQALAFGLLLRTSAGLLGFAQLASGVRRFSGCEVRRLRRADTTALLGHPVVPELSQRLERVLPAHRKTLDVQDLASKPASAPP